MLFTTFAFLFFLVGTYLVYWYLPARLRKYCLLVASAVFYLYFSVAFFLHFAAVVVLNYAAFRAVRPGRRALLALIVTLNLGNLVFFKYGPVLAEIFLASMGTPVQGPGLSPGWVLPLAISFYTFQILALQVDAYRDQIDPRSVGFFDFALFIFFFPQLVAGPIMRYSDFFHQIANVRFDADRLLGGLYLIGFGLFKKILIADAITRIIDPVWAEPKAYSSAAVLVAVVGFPIQVYADFSGYTDIARGLARLFGYEIPENFFAPFQSSSFREFWRRWHVTLSTWLRDYLYVPLGGSRQGPWRLYLSLIATMTLGGLWHGHDVTYFFWGLFHGIVLALERLVGWNPQTRPARIVGMLGLWVIWTFSMAIFRSPDLATFQAVGEALLAAGVSEVPDGYHGFPRLLFYAVVVHLLQYYRQPVGQFMQARRRILIPACSLVLFYLLCRIPHAGQTFVYFQF